MGKRKTTRVVPGNGEKGRPRLDERGAEVLDDTPVTLPVRYQRGENITERVQRMVEETISRRAGQMGLETADEANDFYVEGDDYFPSSEHEVDEDAEAEFEFQRGKQPSGWFKRAQKPAVKGDRENAGEAKPSPELAEKPAKGTPGDQ